MRRPAASGVSALSSFVAKGRQALHKAKAQRVPNLLCWSFFPCRLPCPAGPTVADCSISVDGSLRLVSIIMGCGCSRSSTTAVVDSPNGAKYCPAQGWRRRWKNRRRDHSTIRAPLGPIARS